MFANAVGGEFLDLAGKIEMSRPTTTTLRRWSWKL